MNVSSRGTSPSTNQTDHPQGCLDCGCSLSSLCFSTALHPITVSSPNAPCAVKSSQLLSSFIWSPPKVIFSLLVIENYVLKWIVGLAHFILQTESVSSCFLDSHIKVMCSVHSKNLHSVDAILKQSQAGKSAPLANNAHTSAIILFIFGIMFFCWDYACLPLSTMVAQRGWLLVAYCGFWLACVRYQLWWFQAKENEKNKLAFSSRLCHNHGGASPQSNSIIHI